VIQRSAPTPQHRRGRIGRLRLTPITVLVGLALIGSALFIGWVVVAVDEDQIPLLASGFVVMGASFTAIAIGTLVGMWRAASRAHTGRALGLAIIGGFAALAAIGCFTITALSALVWTS
jgi:hypothetical protein